MLNRLKYRCLLPLVLLPFVLGAALAQNRQCEWTNVSRIVAVGDVHGDCDQLVKCLQAAEVIDKNNKWIGGKTHLVQTGDILDRGPTSKQAMDLMMELESQAEKAGGSVHALIGNHEAFILTGFYEYLHPGETDSYGGMEEFKKSMTPQGRYGRWIRSHNAVIKINDILFMHGGLSTNYAVMSLQEINGKVAGALADPPTSSAAEDQDGPLWYRGLAAGDDDKIKEIVGPAFKKYGVKHMVVGHTITRSLKINVKADGAVIMIDVGMSKTYRQGPAMCLLIEDGKFFTVTDEGQKPLPMK